MASTPLAFASSLPIPFRSSSPKPKNPTQKPTTVASAHSSSSTAWWAPLFGWPSDPDYVDNPRINNEPGKRPGSSDPEPGSGRAGSRFGLGCFTEEKARQLRRKTAEGSSFHDAMYHSAIASRLASDVSGSNQK